MKILILPLVIIVLPAISLFFLHKYLSKQKEISNSLKLVLGILFIAIGLFASWNAIAISIDGMSEKGINCLTGIVFFIPLAVVTYLAGVPILLFKKRRRMIN